MNKAFLIGNLVVDPELKTVGNNIKVCNMRLAVNRKTEEGKEADYYSLKAWRGLGENCAKFLSKGSKIAVCGDISHRNYKDKDGVNHLIVEVNASDIEFLNTKNNNETVTSTYDKRNDVEMKPIDDGNLPF